MTTDPQGEIKVGGLVNKSGKLHLEDILSGFDLENAFIGSAALKPGQWWCPGLASRSRNCSSALSPKRKANSSSSRRFIVARRCAAHARLPRSLTGRIARVCAWTSYAPTDMMTVGLCREDLA